MVRCIVLLLTIINSWSLHAATDMRALGREERKSLKNIEVYFSDIVREASDDFLYLTYKTTPGAWSQALSCPRGSINKVSLEGDIYFVDHRGWYNYRPNSGWNDRSTFSLRDIGPTTYLRITSPIGQPPASATIQCDLGPSDHDTFFYPIDRLRDDGKVDVPSCERRPDGDEDCSFLTRQVLKIMDAKYRDIDIFIISFREQVKAAHKFNAFVEDRTVQRQEAQRRVEGQIELERAQNNILRKAIFYFLLAVAFAIVLLGTGYIERSMRRNM